jgi:hypothetical protein
MAPLNASRMDGGHLFGFSGPPPLFTEQGDIAFSLKKVTSFRESLRNTLTRGCPTSSADCTLPASLRRPGTEKWTT